MTPAFGREALRRFREGQSRSDRDPQGQLSLLHQVPPDAPTDDAVLTVWNGERFVTWEKWQVTAPIESGAEAPDCLPFPASTRCVGGVCGGTGVWLVRDGDRWLMFVGGRRAGNRRKDFASPALEHAIRTAEAWYGLPANGWQAEERRSGKEHDSGEKS